MKGHLLGAHVPTGKGLGSAVREGKAMGCTAVQVFTSNPQQWKPRIVSQEMVEDFNAAREETGIQHVVSHDSYLVNLCAPSDEVRLKSIEGLKGELRRCAQYGIGWAVSHIGGHGGRGVDEGLRIAAQNVKEVLADTEDTVLLAETTAGQGSALGSRFEEVARLIDLAGNPDRLAVCLDTCHIFAAGYDIRTRDGYEAAFADFDRLIGLNKLKAIHCNDSKKGLGSRVDRHAHLGEGEIGVDTFRFLVNDPRFFEVPILLETPDAPEGHQRDLDLLWSMTTNP